MEVATLRPSDTLTRGRDAGRTQPARLTEQPETKMFLHDLRHMAQAIIGPADTLEIALEERNMNLAMTSLRRLKKSTNRVVDLLGHFPPASWANIEKVEPCDVAQVAEDIVDSLAPTLKQENIRVKQRLVTSVFALINRTDLCRILSNLLVNAMEATENHGDTISIEARALCDEWVEIIVRDNGCGVPEEEVAHIFEEGYTTKAQHGGNGLGLAIVKRVVEAHDGTIDVWSRRGEGSRFTVRLPNGQNGNRTETGACYQRTERSRL